MSERANAHTNDTNFRRRLLVTASAIALTGTALVAGAAKAADDSDRPTLWIELGGQLSRLDDGQDVFAPSLMADRPSIFSPPQGFEKPSLYSIDETGNVSFKPTGSNWVLSASVRYGRSSGARHIHQQTNPQTNVIQFTIPGSPPYHEVINQFPRAGRFADTRMQRDESHSILDFQAGKDFGLGMFGSKDGSSAFNLGVRFAQFSRSSSVALKSDSDFHRVYRYLTSPFIHAYHLKEVTGSGYHSNAAGMRAARRFHGIGPSLSWNASAPLIGTRQSSELTFDWGLNAAILFGRQRAKVQHQTTSLYHSKHARSSNLRTAVSHFSTNPPARSRTVTVPNVGGFAGATWRVENFKVSAGYRADLFFNAMDGGIDTRKSENVGFYGPFASVSVGLGG